MPVATSSAEKLPVSVFGEEDDRTLFLDIDSLGSLLYNGREATACSTAAAADVPYDR